MKKIAKILGATAIASTVALGAPTLDDVQAKTETSVTPWYSYNGNIFNDPKVAVDKYFVQALKYDNVKLNGYKINPKSQVAMGGKPFTIYDTEYLKDNKNRIGWMSFEVKDNVVTKKAFKNAHKANKIVYESKEPGASYITYKTNKAHYLAGFNRNGYLVRVEIGVIPQ